MLFFNLSSFYFFYFAAVAVYVIFMPKVLHDIGYSPYQIGIIFALAPLMRFATPFLFLKHIKLDQKVFVFSLFLAILCSIGFYYTIYDFYTFMINNAVLGICLSLILPYIEVIALKDLGKEKYGKSRLFGSIGFMLIALLLGKYLSSTDVALNYYLFVTVMTVIFSLLLLKHDVSHEEKVSSKPFSILEYWPFWASLFFMQVSFGGFYNFFTIYTTDNRFSLEMASYLWSFGVICEIILFYFQAPLLKNNLLLIIKFTIGITAFRWLLLYLFPESLTITFLSQSIHAFSFGLYHSALILYLYTIYENKKLAQQFMYGVAYGLGGFLGAFLSGYLYGEYLFLYSAIFALVALLFLYVKQKTKKQL